MTATRLVFGIGNPGRGDDALGPLCIEGLAALDLPDVDLLTDYQLQVEHLLDLRGRSAVIFVDAAASGPAPCSLTPVPVAAAAGYSTHAVAPAAVLAAYRDHYGEPSPPAQMLGIRGYRFEFGADLSPGARANLAAALTLLAGRLETPGGLVLRGP